MGAGEARQYLAISSVCFAYECTRMHTKYARRCQARVTRGGGGVEGSQLGWWGREGRGGAE